MEPTRRRTRPIRWRSDEEKALLRAYIQKTITTGPAHELIMVPWQAFDGVHTHNCSACMRRINFYRQVGNLCLPPPQVRCWPLSRLQPFKLEILWSKKRLKEL
jgi:hypothetical protein